MTDSQYEKEPQLAAIVHPILSSTSVVGSLYTNMLYPDQKHLVVALPQSLSIYKFNTTKAAPPRDGFEEDNLANLPKSHQSSLEGLNLVASIPFSSRILAIAAVPTKTVSWIFILFASYEIRLINLNPHSITDPELVSPESPFHISSLKTIIKTAFISAPISDISTECQSGSTPTAGSPLGKRSRNKKKTQRAERKSSIDSISSEDEEESEDSDEEDDGSDTDGSSNHGSGPSKYQKPSTGNRRKVSDEDNASPDPDSVPASDNDAYVPRCLPTPRDELSALITVDESTSLIVLNTHLNVLDFIQLDLESVTFKPLFGDESDIHDPNASPEAVKKLTKSLVKSTFKHYPNIPDIHSLTFFKGTCIPSLAISYTPRFDKSALGIFCINVPLKIVTARALPYNYEIYNQRTIIPNKGIFGGVFVISSNNITLFRSPPNDPDLYVSIEKIDNRNIAKQKKLPKPYTLTRKMKSYMQNNKDLALLPYLEFNKDSFDQKTIVSLFVATQNVALRSSIKSYVTIDEERTLLCDTGGRTYMLFAPQDIHPHHENKRIDLKIGIIYLGTISPAVSLVHIESSIFFGGSQCDDSLLFRIDSREPEWPKPVDRRQKRLGILHTPKEVLQIENSIMVLQKIESNSPAIDIAACQPYTKYTPYPFHINDRILSQDMFYLACGETGHSRIKQFRPGMFSHTLRPSDEQIMLSDHFDFDDTLTLLSLGNSGDVVVSGNSKSVLFETSLLPRQSSTIAENIILDEPTLALAFFVKGIYGNSSAQVLQITNHRARLVGYDTKGVLFEELFPCPISHAAVDPYDKEGHFAICFFNKFVCRVQIPPSTATALFGALNYAAWGQSQRGVSVTKLQITHRAIVANTGALETNSPRFLLFVQQPQSHNSSIDKKFHSDFKADLGEYFPPNQVPDVCKLQTPLDSSTLKDDSIKGWDLALCYYPDDQLSVTSKTKQILFIGKSDGTVSANSLVYDNEDSNDKFASIHQFAKLTLGTSFVSLSRPADGRGFPFATVNDTVVMLLPSKLRTDFAAPNPGLSYIPLHLDFDPFQILPPASYPTSQREQDTDPLKGYNIDFKGAEERCPSFSNIVVSNWQVPAITAANELVFVAKDYERWVGYKVTEKRPVPKGIVTKIMYSPSSRYLVALATENLNQRDKGPLFVSPKVRIIVYDAITFEMVAETTLANVLGTCLEVFPLSYGSESDVQNVPFRNNKPLEQFGIMVGSGQPDYMSDSTTKAGASFYVFREESGIFLSSTQDYGGGAVFAARYVNGDIILGQDGLLRRVNVATLHWSDLQPGSKAPVIATEPPPPKKLFEATPSIVTDMATYGNVSYPPTCPLWEQLFVNDLKSGPRIAAGELYNLFESQVPVVSREVVSINTSGHHETHVANDLVAAVKCSLAIEALSPTLLLDGDSDSGLNISRILPDNADSLWDLPELARIYPELSNTGTKLFREAYLVNIGSPASSIQGCRWAIPHYLKLLEWNKPSQNTGPYIYEEASLKAAGATALVTTSDGTLLLCYIEHDKYKSMYLRFLIQSLKKAVKRDAEK